MVYVLLAVVLTVAVVTHLAGRRRDHTFDDVDVQRQLHDALERVQREPKARA